MDSLYVGIDVAKAIFVAAAYGPAGESVWGEFANTPAGFAQWQGRVTTAAAEHNAQAVVVVLEPTGGYELALAGFAAAQGWQVNRPNALRVHDWANSQGRRAKTDRHAGGCARLLARYGAAQPLAAWKPLPRAYRVSWRACCSARMTWTACCSKSVIGRRRWRCRRGPLVL